VDTSILNECFCFEQSNQALVYYIKLEPGMGIVALCIKLEPTNNSNCQAPYQILHDLIKYLVQLQIEGEGETWQVKIIRIYSLQLLHIK
jgi:hypothetical protein